MARPIQSRTTQLSTRQPRPDPSGRWPGAAVLALLAAVFAVPTALAAPAGGADAGRRAFEAVDPFIGTGGEGHTFPGATVPFGMIQLSPDTEIKPRKEAYGWAAGYRYGDPTIVGFSHTHFSGTGHSDLGDVLVMPIAGEVKLERGDSKTPRSGYRSAFRHDDEVAQPGYYAVTLDDYKIRAELTASERVGVHRYRYPGGQAAHVLIDLRTSLYDYPGKVLWSRVRLRADGTVTGFRETRGWAPGRQLYFAMRFSRPVTGHAFHDTEADVLYKGFAPPGEKDPSKRAQIEGRQLVASLDFKDAPGQELIVKVAISPVSEDSAIANLDAEVPGFDFDRVRAQARELADLGHSVSWLARERLGAAPQVLGLLAFRDAPRPGARAAIARLHALGLRTAMISGDHAGAANAVAQQLGIDDVRSDVLPEQKAAAVADLAKAGAVAMVGDGVNDAPALAAADVGIAMGSGTDVAMQAAGITLMRAEPGLVADAIAISRRTTRKIRQNLFWAFGYNVVGIPLAAFGLLDPVFAAAAMAFSSVSVLGNTLLLRRWRPA